MGGVIDLVQFEDLGWFPDRKRMQEYGIHQGENRRVRANAET
jgi:hypothetical protein